ncbi:hypothetical protein [Kitasatospora indigofera]|uniref:hypothetical protein n=1 Tax=Kitasatospora indigofera TaxID=67307 RepID=UPI003570E3F1
MPAAVLVSAGLACAALYLPFLRSVLETDPLAWPDLVAAAFAAFTGFVAARTRTRSGRRAERAAG